MIEGRYGHTNSKLIYGTFTTPTNSIPGSAVCAFSLQDITDTFEGNFKEQSGINSNWLPVNSAKVNINKEFIMIMKKSNFKLFPFL